MQLARFAVLVTLAAKGAALQSVGTAERCLSFQKAPPDPNQSFSGWC